MWPKFHRPLVISPDPLPEVAAGSSTDELLLLFDKFNIITTLMQILALKWAPGGTLYI